MNLSDSRMSILRGSWELKLYLTHTHRGNLLLIVSYIGADAPLMLGSIQLVLAKTMKAHRYTQKVYIGLV